MNKSIFKPIGLILKIIILLSTVWYLYYQLFVKHDIQDTARILEGAYERSDFLMLSFFIIVLMIINWGLEAFKWQKMISGLEKIKFNTAFESVLTGVTVSFFTPNRIGEFGGRIFYLEKADRVQAALICILASMSQLIVTIVAGGIALMFFIYLFVGMDKILFYALIFLILISISVLLFLFINVNVFHTLLVRLKLPKKIANLLEAFEHFTPADLSLVILISFLRYGVFTTQFLLLLRMMDVSAPVLPTAMMIAMTYLVMSIPTFAVAELGLRSVVAVEFIGILSGNTSGIIASSFLLYLINVALPAVLGAFFVFKLKFFRNTK